MGHKRIIFAISVATSLIMGLIFGLIVYGLLLLDLKSLKEKGDFGPGAFMMGFLAPPKATKWTPPKACETDAAKFCANKPNILCLRDFMDQLEGDCQQLIREGIIAELGSCKEDFERLCPGVAPGQGRIKGCLMMNKLKVSQACRDQLALDQ